MQMEDSPKCEKEKGNILKVRQIPLINKKKFVRELW